MASTSTHCQQQDLDGAFRKVQVTILASEWGSSRGGLSTVSRELAIQLAKFPNSQVEITVFLPRCSEEDKSQALKNNVTIFEAIRRPGFDELDWLSFPPEHLQIDVIVGHGVKLGRQAQVIKELKKCKWVQVVHTDPEELGMFKSYSNPIPKGQEKHKIEVELCEMADLVVGVGPKLSEAFRSYLRGCQKDQNVVDFTPGVFDEFSSVKQSPNERKQCSILVFGRGDDEDFELKGFDIAGKAAAALPNTRLVFVGADGNHKKVAEQLTVCGVPPKSLRVREFVQNREDLKPLFLEVDLVLMPSRTEGFGLTGLEALSAGLPVLVSQNSGFGEALSKVPFGSSFVIDSEDPAVWAAAIQRVWRKDRQGRLEEAETLRSYYEKKYSWGKQSRDFLDKMISLVYGTSDSNTVLQEHVGTKSRADCLQGAGSSVEENLKSLQSNQGKVRKGLRQVEAEKKSFSVPRICYEIASCEGDIALFAGRHHEDTRKWLFDDFDSWFNNPGNSRAYVLLGDAGVGKSVIAGTLAQRMMKDGLLGAAYFCRHYDGTRSDPRNLLGTIACQLCDCNCEYSEIMGGKDGVRGFLADSNLGVQELCTKLLEEPLNKCSPFQRKLVIIDALDETEYKSRKDFIFLIKERFLRLPKWLVFFITSRPEDLVQRSLQRYNPCVRICAGNSEQGHFYQQHEQDIKRFLENSVDFSRLPYSAEDVTSKCNGLFLYASLIKKELDSSSHSGKVIQLSDLIPGDIYDFFEGNFQRVYKKLEGDLYSKLLGCMVSTPSPLPMSFLPFVLHRENSSLNEQKVIDAVSQFVVLQETVTFLHDLIPEWLTDKRKAQELHIDEEKAGEYFTEIVKGVLSTFVGEPRLKLKSVERDLRRWVVQFAVQLLCQQEEKDSLKLVFSCLTSYRFLEERIGGGRFGIYHLLKDFELAASSPAFKGTEKQNILQKISLAIESDRHILIESPHLLLSCIQSAAAVVQENILIPHTSSPCLEQNIYHLFNPDFIFGCNCFAIASDKQIVAGAKDRSLFFFSASMLEMVSGPFEISEETISKITHLEFCSEDKFIFFGRLDKWFSVENECVEELTQFTGNDLVYQWGLITPNERYIVVKTNVLHFPGMCERGCCLTELVALWATMEIEQSRDEKKTFSFRQLSKWIARIGISGMYTRELLEHIDVEPESYQTHTMFVPDDSSCYCCCRLKELLTESNQELSLVSVRQLIIELYNGLFRYQVWNLQSGQPFLDDVFNQGAQLNLFAFSCCGSTEVYNDWFSAYFCSDFNEAVSVCNIAVLTAVYFLFKRDLERFRNGQLSEKEDDWKFDLQDRLKNLFRDKLEDSCSLSFWLDWLHLVTVKDEMRASRMLDEHRLEKFFYRLEFDEEMMVTRMLHEHRLEKLCYRFEFDEEMMAITMLHEHRLEEFRDELEFRAAKLKKVVERWKQLYFVSDCDAGVWKHFPRCRLVLPPDCDSDVFGHVPKGFVEHHAEFNFLSLSPKKEWMIRSSVPGMICFLPVSIKKENSSRITLHIPDVEHFTFTNDDDFVIYSPFSGLDSLHAMSLQTGKKFTSVSGCHLVGIKREKQIGYLFRSVDEEKTFLLKDLFNPFKFAPRGPSQEFGFGCVIAAVFTSNNTIACINSDLMVLTTILDDKRNAFYFCSFSVQSPHLTKKCVFSPDGNLIAFQQENKIQLHRVWEYGGFPYTVFETDFDVTDSCLKFSADSSSLFLCIQDNFNGQCFYVWDVGEQAMSSSFEPPGLLTVDCFCFSPDENRLVLCGDYGEIEIWDFNNKRAVRLLKKLDVKRFFSSVRFSHCTISPDNELLVCCIGNAIVLFNLLSAEVNSSKRILLGHLGKIEFCRFLKVNRYLISYAIDGMIFLWDITESRAIGFTKITHGEEKMTSMAVSTEENRVICFLSSNRVCVVNLCNLESALASKSSLTLARGKVDTTESREQLKERMPSSFVTPVSFLEDETFEASSNSDEECFIPEEYFFESEYLTLF